jgi:two-component system, LytTR family, response regulator
MQEPFKVIIVDDELSVIENIKDFLLMLYPNQAEIVAEASNYNDAVNILQTNNADILFIDINLRDGKSGFDVLDSIRDNIYIQPIFVTAFDNFALKAFEYEAIDYLLKPISMSDLKKAVDKVLKRRRTSSIKAISSVIKELADNNESQKRIIISDRNGWQIIKIDDILYLEADGSYCILHLSNGNKITSSRNMKHIDTLMEHNADFFKVHKSYMVNKRHILSYIGARNVLVMSNDSTIPVTLTSKEIMEALK